MAVLVDLEGVSVRRADRELFDGLSLTVADGDRVGVVGINGAGKSTLLRVLAGLETPDAGHVRRGRGIRLGYLGQEPALPPGSVRDAVGQGWEAEAGLSRLGMGEAGDLEVSQLSGGQAKRVSLASVIARPAELLVLDEPTNHLDLRAVAWLESWLLDSPAGVVLVTHDRHLLDRVTTRMIELDRGRSYVHDGGYAAYLAAAVERDQQAASADECRRNLARRELAWLRRGAPARTRKPKARIETARRIIESSAQAPARATELELSFGARRLGDKVVECAGVGYRYEEDEGPVLSDVDLVLDPDERLGLVGANGSGKSTLLDLLSGRRTPTAGSIEQGLTVVTGYYEQRDAELDPDARVRELVAGPARAPGSPEDIALMKRFWFAGALQYARAGTLSGGERRRLQLLLVLSRRPNVLLLDEPTNDLDLETMRVLEDFLDDWPGALVVVSHDRTFLGRTTDRLIAVEGGTVSPVPGGLDAWMSRGTAATVSGGRAAPPVERAAAADRAAPATARRRSTSTIGRELRDAEKEMAQITRARDTLMTALVAACDDHVEMVRLGRKLTATQARLTDAENRWLTLAEEAEAAKR